MNVSSSSEIVSPSARRRIIRGQTAWLSEADARTRTGDPFITSEVLYQLSYVGKATTVAGLRFDFRR